jgi:hypothetical protein
VANHYGNQRCGWQIRGTVSDTMDTPKCENGCGQDADLQSAECALCTDCFGDLMRDTLRPVLGRDICGRPIMQTENGERAVCLALYGTEHEH